MTLLHALPRRPLALLLIVMVVTIPSFPSAAAEGDEVMTPSELAQVSGVATPFVGTYEMWCTVRNPGVSCTNHHRTPGVDVGMTVGTPLYAAGDGVVVETEAECRALGCRGGAGLFIEVGHADGTSSRYLHLDEVFVDVGDEIRVGQLIATSGDTGQSSSPHLHYDEKDGHYPYGNRAPFGPWLSCVGGEVVQYPDALGYTSWNEVPYGSMIVNEGFECLGGVALTSLPPLVFSGDGIFGVAAPTAQSGTDFEIEVTTTTEAGSVTSVRSVTSDRMLRFTAAEGATYEIRMRAGFSGIWSTWSEPVQYDPSVPIDAPLCRNLHASGDNGTADVDVLIGTAADDTLFGLEGDDIICAGAGHDHIDGGDGDDRIDAGDGNDTVVGGPGRDRIAGGMGRDVIDAGPGRDRVNGGAAADEIVGDLNSDVLIGGSGSDLVRGGNGGDKVFGNNGDDILFGGGGNDRLFGTGGIDTLDGGAGIDRCSATTGDDAEAGEVVDRCEL